MKSLLTIAASVLVAATSAHAQPAPAPSTDHESHHTGPASAAGQEGRWTQGEVRKVDLENGKLTLRHGPIRNLDMPGMTMVFKVADRKLLDKLKEGDKVRFAAERANGAITVTDIEVAQ